MKYKWATDYNYETRSLAVKSINLVRKVLKLRSLKIIFKKNTTDEVKLKSYGMETTKYDAGKKGKCRCEQDSNLRGETPLDFKSNALTTRPSQQDYKYLGSNFLSICLDGSITHLWTIFHFSD